jgi:protein TonB
MIGLLTVSNLLAWSVQVAILVVAVLLTMRFVQVGAPDVRHGVLRVLLAVCLLLPVLQPYGPGGAGVETGVQSVAAAGGGAEESRGRPGAGTILGLAEASWGTPLMLLIAAGIVARLGWIATGVVRLRRLRRAGEVARLTDEHDELQAMIRTRATIRYVNGLGQPVTFGFRRPVVLLPESLVRKPPAIRRAVIAHELWHVRRRDWIWTLVEEALRAIFWFHPALWTLLSRIQRTREEVVDELTVLATGSRKSYVDALLAFADEPPLFVAAAFARRRHLVHRMVLISKEAVMSARRVVISCAALAAVMVSASWYAVRAFPLTQSQAASEVMSEAPGPVELRARPITPENPVPRRTFFVAPEYPHAAALDGVRGWVTVRLAIDDSGRVAETRVTGVSLSMNDKASITLQKASPESFERAMHATVKLGSGDRAVSLASFRAALESVIVEAARSVSGWRYAPPAEGPLAFSVNIRFGPPAAAGPPPPPPPPPGQPGATTPNSSDGALRVGGNIKAPTKIKNVNPIYPEDALAAKVQGVVILEVRVEADGTVGDAEVLRSIPMLDDAALEAVRQWEFTPTLMNGAPVPVMMTVTVNFTLSQ